MGLGFLFGDIESTRLICRRRKRHLSTGSSLLSFPSIGHLLAVLIIAYGCATPAYAADAVNINTASIEVLAEEVIGVGSELAKRIVDFRERYGDFK